jgi:hypothetical protein
VSWLRQLSNQGSKVEDQMKEGLMGLVSDSPKALQFKVGTIPMKYVGIDHIDPQQLNPRIDKDKDLTR